MPRPLASGRVARFALALLLLPSVLAGAAQSAQRFEGEYFAGEGDVDYLQLLDLSRRVFTADPEFQNLPMLYTPAWNGFVEGPTWGAWWIQNSYGPTYCGLPVMQEPLVTFLQNAQDLWFDQMGDNQRTYTWKDHTWVIPDGQLCDAAAPGVVYSKQGDGNVAIHDWGVEFTAAGVVMQAELLLIGRDPKAIAHYLPLLERSVEFLESRRDPANNLFLAGPAGNLLAPSYAGYKKPDGTYGQAYLSGLSVTYIAALDRMMALEKMAGNNERVRRYAQRRAQARQGLAKMATDEGYFIKSLDPDGTRHGVYGAEKHGYFEAVSNHDAICFHVVDDAQAEKIYQKMASIAGLRPHHLVITNCPGLDDMYEEPNTWLWKFGTWVNGGHWSTCEARMVMAYYRLGHYDDVRQSVEAILPFARAFRMDNPLVDFGAAVYQPKEPINLCYDTFGPATAMIRGLFEYRYGAEGLTIVPQIPPTITRLEQHFPIRFGKKQVYLACEGTGPVRSVSVNGQPWSRFSEKSVFLSDAETPDEAVVAIGLGDAKPAAFVPKKPTPQTDVPELSACGWSAEQCPKLPEIAAQVRRVGRFAQALEKAGMADGYEAAHARLALAAARATVRRAGLLRQGTLAPLPEASQRAADQSYLDTIARLCEGLGKKLASYGGNADPQKATLAKLWEASDAEPGGTTK